MRVLASGESIDDSNASLVVLILNEYDAQERLASLKDCKLKCPTASAIVVLPAKIQKQTITRHLRTFRKFGTVSPQTLFTNADSTETNMYSVYYDAPDSMQSTCDEDFLPVSIYDTCPSYRHSRQEAHRCPNPFQALNKQKDACALHHEILTSVYHKLSQDMHAAKAICHLFDFLNYELVNSTAQAQTMTLLYPLWLEII
jgi:hypothetical protein